MLEWPTQRHTRFGVEVYPNTNVASCMTEADARLVAHAPSDLEWTTRELRLALTELERTRQRVRDLKDTLQKRVDTIDRAISRAAEGVARGEDTYEGLNPAEAYHEGLCDAFMYARGMS